METIIFCIVCLVIFLIAYYFNLKMIACLFGMLFFVLLFISLLLLPAIIDAIPKIIEYNKSHDTNYNIFNWFKFLKSHKELDYLLLHPKL
jgi:ABC-type transport system involved in cytochrome bd biosynthesis fused ATPase/permease subunit